MSAFGFGGSNFHCVLEEAEGSKAGVDWDGETQILAVSAPDRERLLAGLKALPRGLDWPAFRAEAARTRATFDPSAARRVVFVATKGSDLDALLARAEAAVSAPEGAPRPRDGVFVGSGPVPGKLALLFPGQGSQYPGMLGELACVFPRMQDALAEADAAGHPADGPLLSDRIYPPPAFDDAGRAASEAALRETSVAQPAIGAVSLGALRVLEGFGIAPDLAAGHSFGELTALCASGRIAPDAFLALARERGRLMGEQAGLSGGSMVAVLAPADEVAAVLKAEGLDASVVIANKNGPRQCVLSGPSAAIEQAAEAFRARGLTAKALAVSAAFHSPIVAGASGPFRRALDASAFAEGSTPTYANTTAGVYPAGPAEARALIAEQLAKPVEFVAMVREMAADGAGVFLEVGPGATLSGLVRSILGETAKAIALDASRGERGGMGDLALTLAELAAFGYPVRLARWDEPAASAARPTRKPGLTVKVSGANVFAPRPPAPRKATSPTPIAADAPPARPSPAPTPAAPLPSASTSTTKPRPPVASPPMTPTPPAPSSHATPSRPRTEPAPVAGTNGQHPAANGHAPASSYQPGGNGHVSSPMIPIAAGSDPALIAEALRAATENLAAIQALSAQTADLHRKFLEGQDKTQRSFQSLLEQQHRLTLATLQAPAPVAAPPAPSLPEPLRARIEPSRPVHAPAPTPVRPAPAPAMVKVTPASKPAPIVAKAAPVVTPAPKPAPSADAGRLMGVLLEVVSEKTGYPAEMLEPDMQLDADLGIDSIKRVEILSALQERLPEAPVIKPEHLGTLRTLREIAGFLGASEAAAAPVSKPAPSADAGRLMGVLLEVVSEKTGYPAEMLEPDMQLDADLGIDSIKRVEILSALQERLPEAPVIKPEHLGTLRTLREIAGFLGASEAAAAPVSADAGRLMGVLLEVVSEKTGYPAEMLEPDMQLDADLGIDSIKRVEILSALQERLPEAPVIKPEHLGTLRTLREIAGFLGASEAAAPIPAPKVLTAPATVVESRLASAGVQRLVVRLADLPTAEASTGSRSGDAWVVHAGSRLAKGIVEGLGTRGLRVREVAWDDEANEVPRRLEGLVLIAPESSDAAVASAFRRLRALGPALKAAEGSFAAGVTEVDGGFGLKGGFERQGPEVGGFAGLLKTAGHEWAGVSCRAIDVEPEMGAEEAAAAVVGECLRTGPAEVGIAASGRSTPVLSAEPTGAEGRPALDAGDVVIVTGGARGVTAEVAVALAQAYRPTLVLLGRSAAPEREPEWLAPLSEESEIKRALATRANGHATPHRVGEEFRRLSANREVSRTLARIEAAGAKAAYRAVDVRDPEAVRAVIAGVRAEFGPVRGVVHGAGVLADRTILDQTDAQFADVYGTKVEGLRATLGAIDDDLLKVLVLFSSSTARFGRTGQVAYAAANEVMNKWAQREAKARPGCRVVAVNWGPWDGGMVTASLKPLFEAEGVGLIGLAEGASYLVHELNAGESPVEVVILGAGSNLPLPTPPEPAKSVDSEPTPALASAFEVALDLDALPILKSHVIDGRGVVPMALILEWLAQGAIQRNPGLAFVGVDDLRLLKGIVLHDSRPETVSVLVGKATRGAGEYRVPVELRGRLAGGRTVLHARAEVVLGDRPAKAEARAIDPASFPGRTLSPKAMYHDVLFHGPDLHGLERVEALGADGIVAVARTAPAPSAWLERPSRQSWLSDPLAIDGAFQLMTYWSFDQTGAPSLPTKVGKYRQYRKAWGVPRVRVVLRTSLPSALHATADIEWVDEDGTLIARAEGYECVSNPSLNQAFRRNRPAQQVAGSPR